MDDFFDPNIPGATATATAAFPSQEPGFDAEDLTADFLAREQAALGEDHAFVTGASSLLGQTAQQNLPTSSGAVAETPFGVAGAAQAPPPFGTSDTYLERQAEDSDVESEAVGEWRRKFAEAIAERDRKSEQKRGEQLETAKQAIDRFYEEYNQRKQQAHAANRESETQQAAESASGTNWERIAREVEAAVQSQGKAAKSGPSRERFRELLSDLRKDKSAPGLKA